jgi:hypothetical protein
MVGSLKSPSAGEDTLKALTRLLASREPLTVLLDELLRLVEQLTPDMRCAILLADLSAKVLRSGAAPSLPLEYTNAIDALPITDGVVSCGPLGFVGLTPILPAGLQPARLSRRRSKAHLLPSQDVQRILSLAYSRLTRPFDYVNKATDSDKWSFNLSYVVHGG